MAAELASMAAVAVEEVEHTAVLVEALAAAVEVTHTALVVSAEARTAVAAAGPVVVELVHIALEGFVVDGQTASARQVVESYYGIVAGIDVLKGIVVDSAPALLAEGELALCHNKKRHLDRRKVLLPVQREHNYLEAVMAHSLGAELAEEVVHAAL